jgi:hypothetical protein
MRSVRSNAGWVAIMLAAILALVCTASAYAASTVELKVLDPRAELFTSPSVPISARLRTLDGKKIGILKNSKPGGDDFAPALMQVLKEVYPTIEFKLWSIPYNEYPNKDNDLKALAACSDAVIGMLGD